MKTNDGGPAFPVVLEERCNYISGPPYVDVKYPGMTLRDWFAGMALQGILANDKLGMWGPNATNDYALTAYTQADAMLKARDEK